MKKILALIASLVINAGASAQINNPTTVTAGTGLNKAGNTLSVKYGTIAGTATQGNDTRLSNPAVTPTTLTNHGVVVGQGASAIVATSAGTSGQCLISNGAAADPTFQACSAGGSGVVNSGTSGQITYYGATGNTVSGNTNANIANGTLTLGTTNTTLGSVVLDGSTSGAVTVQPAAAAGTWTMTLPTTAGSNLQFLQTNGTGVTTWAAPAGSGTVNSGTAGQLSYYATSTNAVSSNTNANIANGTLTLGTTNTTLGSVVLDGSTSGAVTVQPAAAAGTWTMTLPTTAGSNLQVLQTNGSGVTTWATPAAGGITLLATLTPTASATLNSLSSFSATYDNYEINCSGIQPAIADQLTLRLANGGTLDTGSNYIATGNLNTTAASATSTNLSVIGGNAIASTNVNFTLRIYNANDATGFKSVYINSVYETAATPSFAQNQWHNVYKGTNAISGFGLFWAGANNFVATGKCRVYGFAN